MNNIVDGRFMLHGATAERLYRDYAEGKPIIDYHCHLNPEYIASDHVFSDIGELMLGGDHYKWRAMRSFGIEESLITGDAGWKDKFFAFAGMMPYCIGNPLYHWTHLELKRYFGIDEALTAESAGRIYDACSAVMADGSFSARKIITASNVECLCTTDDPADSLEYHAKTAADRSFKTLVLPAFRPDRAVAIFKPEFRGYIEKTGVHSYAELKKWMLAALDKFEAAGCRLADHGMDYIPYAEEGPECTASSAFDAVMEGKKPSKLQADVYMTDLVCFLGREYARRGWCMQLHMGALRNNSSRMFRAVGADTGFDSIADTCNTAALSRLLDRLDSEDMLPKTILYSLNGNDNYVLAALMGAFQKGPDRSKLQLGSGWWFNDQRDGMEAQLKALANLGILGCFVGMLTDSRSFISYPRHEYFRRILCNLIGGWVDSGEYPDAPEYLGRIITGISCDNAREYFSFGNTSR